jgi:hypothetical protein
LAPPFDRFTPERGTNDLTIKIKDTSLADDNCSCTP